MSTLHLTIQGVPLRVKYAIDWGYPDTREEPGMPAHLCDLNVFAGEVDVTEVLSHNALEEIEVQCFLAEQPAD